MKTPEIVAIVVVAVLVGILITGAFLYGGNRVVQKIKSTRNNMNGSFNRRVQNYVNKGVPKTNAIQMVAQNRRSNPLY